MFLIRRSPNSGGGMPSIAKAPSYAVYPRQFVDMVRKATGSGGLCRQLARNFADTEHRWVHALLEGKYANAQEFWTARQLYHNYQVIARYEHDDSIDPYVPLAMLEGDRRIWCAGEHVFVQAILEGDFNPEELWSLRVAYDQFKSMMIEQQPDYRSVGQTYLVDRRW